MMTEPAQAGFVFQVIAGRDPLIDELPQRREGRREKTLALTITSYALLASLR